MKSLGERIRELRDEKDISLRELGKRLDVSAAFLSDVELGRRHPSEKVLVELARVLQTKLEDLRAYDTRPPVDEIKRLATLNPAYGVAFRKLVDCEISAEELIKMVDNFSKKKNK